jgi:small subunit ribosomal protein S17
MPAKSGADKAGDAAAQAAAAHEVKPPQTADVEPGAPRPNRRKVREGIVVSDSMDKTAIVLVVERVRHARYAKTVQRSKRLYAHDEANDAKVGDRVRIAEVRPLSKLKRWRVAEVLERAR